MTGPTGSGVPAATHHPPGEDAQLRPVDAVLDELLRGLEPLGAEEVAPVAALGRVLAADVVATTPLPRADNAAMDGFAVRAADTQGASDGDPCRLQVVDGVWAGHPSGSELAAGTAAPIATGAPLPAGADAVVRVERTSRDGARVLVTSPVAVGRDVRRRGEDLDAGQVVVASGTVLGPTALAAAAGVGVSGLRVHRRPRLTVLLTGDEVAPVGAELGPGQVHDAVGPALVALARDTGADVAPLGVPVGDDTGDLARALGTAAAASDIVTTVGGVSKGARDHLADVLGQLGTAHRASVALRPAKPFVHGCIEGTTVLGLPGNPAAALVAFEVFGRPVLRRLLGRPVGAAPLSATLEVDVRQKPGRRHYVRAVVTRHDGGRRTVRPAGAQGAAMLHSLGRANAWLVLPESATSLPAGSEVEVRTLWGDGGEGAWQPR